MTGRTVVAGIGNIFCSDDGFGSEVARALLAAGELPRDVQVTDYGIRGLHLAYDLAAGFGAAILVDAVSRGEPPGTLFVIEPEAGRPVPADPAAAADETVVAGAALPDAPMLDAHGMQPDVVLRMLETLAGPQAGPDDPARGPIRIVGCEPASLDYGIGLSGPVTAAVPQAVKLVRRLLAEHLSGPPERATAPAPAARRNQQ